MNKKDLKNLEDLENSEFDSDFENETLQSKRQPGHTEQKAGGW